ncbi:hypothetical protein ScPMuIL_000694 [Solemya velum]
MEERRMFCTGCRQPCQFTSLSALCAGQLLWPFISPSVLSGNVTAGRIRWCGCYTFCVGKFQNQREGKEMATKGRALVIYKANKKLKFVPLMFVLFHVWGVIWFAMYQYAGKGILVSSGEWASILKAVGDNAQGFINMFIFCVFTVKVRRNLVKFVIRCVEGRRGSKQTLNTRQLSELVNGILFETDPPRNAESKIEKDDPSFVTSSNADGEQTMLLQC